MQENRIRAIGIDTSCYTTSIAIVEGNVLLLDKRLPIVVKSGDIGLRQSDILFQHMNNLTELMESIKGSFPLNTVSAVGYSAAPRSQADSYMPVFLAGKSLATTISAVLDCPLLTFSHQDGHMAAVQCGSPLLDRFAALHLSGGTTEMVRVRRNGHFGYDAEIIGGTLDISFGQLLDRVGVYCGLPFPAGPFIDAEALRSDIAKDFIGIKPAINDGWFNISGYENKIKKIVDQKEKDDRDLYKSILLGVANTLMQLIEKQAESDETVFIAGGVSASAVVRQQFSATGFDRRFKVRFGSPAMSTDNAVGIALLTAEAEFLGGSHAHTND